MNEADTIPVWRKVAYGAGDGGINLAYTAIGFYLLWFMVNVGGLSPGTAGLAFLLARIWDALIDYGVGRISDATRSRWGRRRPYLLFGAIPVAVCFAVLWQVPDAPESLKFAYYTLVLMAFNTAFAFVVIPYGALMAEMTQDYQERTKLAGIRMGFAFAGTLLGAAGVSLLVDVWFASWGKVQAFQGMGVILGVLAAVLIFVAALGSREKVRSRPFVQDGFWTTLLSLFRLREFRLALGMFLLNMVGFDIIMSVFLFYVGDVMGVAGDTTVFMAIPLVVAMLVGSLWVYLGNRYGKTRTYGFAVAYFVPSLLLFFFLPSGNLTGLVVVCILIGIGVSATQILPFSVMPDVIEMDEYKNGVRREGAFFGLTIFSQTLTSALAVAATGALLELGGYVEAALDADVAAPAISQPDSALWMLRFLLGIVPGLCFIGSAIFSHRLAMTKEKFDAIQRELQARGSS